MTNPVVEARARAQAALARWREARAAVNNPASVPHRLDAIVAVAERAIAVIGQDIVTEVEAIVVELAALRFQVELDEALSGLESATLSLDGGLGRLSRAASRAGFAEGEDDLGLPPGVRMPAQDIAKQLEAFVAAVEGVRPVLERIARAQAAEPGPDAKQEALVRNVIDKASVKIDIIGIKTGKISLIDVTGLAALARELNRILQSFVATVGDAALRLSSWLAQEAPGWIEPVLRPLERGATQLAKGAATWIDRRSGGAAAAAPEPPIDSAAPVEPGFNWLEIEAMVLRGEVPPADVIPFFTSFDATGTHQKAIPAIGHLKALRKLSIRYAPVSDLAPLAGLTALQSLSLAETQVSDLAPLAGLAALQSLSLDGTQLSDLAPLARLTALQSVSLDGTQVSDLTPLAGLTALQSVNLHGTQVSDLAPLAGLTALRSLNLDGTQVSDPAPLMGLTALQSLSFGGTKVSDLAPLVGLTALRSLGLYGTQVSDAVPLAGLTALQSLSLDHTQVSDLAPLMGLTALQSLSFGDTQISSLTPLAGLTALQSLELDNTQVSDLAPLVGLTALQSLSLVDTQVSSLAPLAGLTALQSLSLDRTQVSDLAPLAGLTALQSLSLDGTQVSDLAPLADLTALRSLSLVDTQVNNLASLRNLRNLGAIVIAENEALIATLGLPTRWRDLYYEIKRAG